MRRLIALTIVVAALGVGATSASAAGPDPYAQGQRVCERQAGLFGGIGGFYYSCVSISGDFLERQIQQASRLCVRNGGYLEPYGYYYFCYFI